MALTPELIGLTLEGRDHLLELLEAAGQPDGAAAPEPHGILER